MVMCKTKAIIIAFLFSFTLYGQSRNDSIKVVNNIIPEELLQLLFSNDIEGILDYCEQRPELVYTHNLNDDKRKLKKLWKLNVFHENYSMQIIVYSTEFKSEISRIYIELETAFIAKKFINYFCPLANFRGPESDGRFYRMMQTAEILQDYDNVVFFWLTYPPLDLNVE